MLLYDETNIYQNFDLSIIIYVKIKNFHVFKHSFIENIKYFQRNGIEIIIPIYEYRLIKPLRDFIMVYPFVSWKVIFSNDTLNLPKALNLGINYASKNYILTLHYSIEYRSDVLYKLRVASKYYIEYFILGALSKFTTKGIIKQNSTLEELMIFGSMLVRKEHILKIHGFSEDFSSWIECHNNLFARLEMSGIKKMFLANAISYFTSIYKLSYYHIKDWENKALTYNEIKNLFISCNKFENSAVWNDHKIKFIYDWQNNKYSYILCRKYLDRFLDFYLKGHRSFKIKYKIIALIPTYNEIKNIEKLLKNIEKYCDGIIVLDDSSNDGTYKAINSSKLLLKVQKKRTEFNDLDNRNILLNLASFFNSKWYLFIDADERIDERFSDVYSIAMRDDIDSVWFKIVELWDNKDFCRADLPIGKDEKGVFRERLRMFRNQGRMQLLHKRKLHFYTIPYQGISIKSKILLHHYGTLYKEDRLIKYNTYLKEDVNFKNNSHLYEYLLDEKVLLKSVNSLKL